MTILSSPSCYYMSEYQMLHLYRTLGHCFPNQTKIFIFLHLSPKQPQDANSDQENHSPPNGQSLDIEDIARRGSSSTGVPVATKRKHGQMTLGSSSFKSKSQASSQLSEGQLSQTWKEVLGESPQWGPNKVKIVSLGHLTVV